MALMDANTLATLEVLIFCSLSNCSHTSRSICGRVLIKYFQTKSRDKVPNIPSSGSKGQFTPTNTLDV